MAGGAGAGGDAPPLGSAGVICWVAIWPCASLAVNGYQVAFQTRPMISRSADSAVTVTVCGPRSAWNFAVIGQALGVA